MELPLLDLLMPRTIDEYQDTTGTGFGVRIDLGVGIFLGWHGV
jgi:hypothetical protein